MSLRPRPASSHLALGIAALAALTAAPTLAEEPAAPRLLPLPLALGGTPGFFGPSPGTADLAAHLRGTILFGTERPGAPALAMRWNLGASASLWRWAEAGVRFSGRWDLETRQHAPGPVELWLRAGPPERSVLGGAALQAVLEHTAGRGGFDEGGRLWTSTTNLGAAAATQRWRFRVAGSLTYERAEADGAPAVYQGLRASAGAWFAAAKAGEHLGLDVGADALVRVGGMEGPRGPLDVAAVFAIGVRLVDENGAAFRFGYGQGYGPGMPARFGLAGLGWSYGRGYVHQRSTPALLDQLSDWLREQWAQRTAPGFGALWLPPPSLLTPPMRPPTDLAGALRRRQPQLCDGPLPHRGGDAVALALRSCSEAWDLGRRDALTAGPPAPQEPYGPPIPPGALASGMGGPPRATGGMPRNGLRPGRAGPGYTEAAEGEAEHPRPQSFLGGPAGTGSLGRPDAPRPGPNIPIDPLAPLEPPPWLPPGALPPALRRPAAERPPPPAAARRGATHLAPMGPPAPRPSPSPAAPRPGPDERPASQRARPAATPPPRSAARAAAEAAAETQTARRTDCPNPWGCNGAPDHQATVKELLAEARRQYPDESRYEIRENKSIRDTTNGVSRRPDVSVIDIRTGRVVHVYEAARANADGETPVARERKKVEQYDRAGIPSTVRIVR